MLFRSAEHERLYLAEAQDSGLRDYAKTNSREYFADCFVYWITYSGNEKPMETFWNTAPQTYAYMEKLAANNWGAEMRTDWEQHFCSQPDTVRSGKIVGSDYTAGSIVLCISRQQMT